MVVARCLRRAAPTRGFLCYQQLEQERQRAAILAERLRAAGIDPEQIF